MRIIILLLLSLWITACSLPLAYTFNDVLIFRPNAPEGADNLVADINLQACINQFLSGINRDSEKSELDSITLLACPAANIQNLSGIENLPKLEQLDLSDNNISSLAPLSNLRNLRVLSIRNNNIRSISTLLSMPILRFISLQGNNEIACGQLDRLAEKNGNSLNRPLICKD